MKMYGKWGKAPLIQTYNLDDDESYPRLGRCTSKGGALSVGQEPS
jgi:hypothetical protein